MQYIDGELCHIMESPLEEGAQVVGKIDWNWRFDLMQQHSGEHIVSGMIHEKYGYEKLRFLEGDIADYTGVNKVDMVVTLHACDTATDYALQKAMKWNAKVIFSVPCCQHEVNRQIQNDILEPVLKYGILKERMAAIITDAVRAETLEMAGYDTQILEFIDMEHTPKNLLIRAVKRNPSEQTLNIQQSKAAERRSQIETGLSRMTQELHIHTTLHKLMEQEES